MLKIIVCKTVVPYPEATKYAIVCIDGSFSTHVSIGSLAAQIRIQFPAPGGSPRFIKNEAPVDIVCVADGVTELTKLSRDEVRDLARELRK